MTEYERYWKLKDLKDEGHKLIKQVAKRKRVTVDRVYVLLQKRLGFALEESAHFRNMHTVRDVEKAIKELNAMLNEPKQKLKPVTLPLAEQKRLLGVKQPKRFYVWWPKVTWKRVNFYTYYPK